MRTFHDRPLPVYTPDQFDFLPADLRLQAATEATLSGRASVTHVTRTPRALGFGGVVALAVFGIALTTLLVNVSMPRGTWLSTTVVSLLASSVFSVVAGILAEAWGHPIVKGGEEVAHRTSAAATVRYTDDRPLRDIVERRSWEWSGRTAEEFVTALGQLYAGDPLPLEVQAAMDRLPDDSKSKVLRHERDARRDAARAILDEVVATHHLGEPEHRAAEEAELDDRARLVLDVYEGA